MNKVCVKDQRIYFYRRPEPIPKSQVNFSRIEFDMDETWSSFLSVVAQFIQGGEPKNVQVKDGYCFVPPELEVGDFELCLRGDDGESVVASVNRLTFEVCEGFDPSGETPLPPSPDLYTQLIKEIDSGKKIAQSVREDADSGKFNGGWYTPSVTQTDENTLRMDFTPSKGDMPDVEHTDIMLPDGGGGTSDHSKLSNRDAADQHPMSAITGLADALAGKQPTGTYLTEETDPTVPDWAKEEKKPSYTAAEVGADPSGTAESKVAAHNTGTDTHSDIRLLIQGLTERLNTLADSDDTTLDQLSEIVSYIKSNRDLISAITTDKVSMADIIDNLTTNVTNKPLSAAQGVALKALIDAITIPTALPNPNALTFTGAVSGSYDGSAPLEVAIPSGGGGLTVTNTAAVGQTVKIAAVDETGQPTEWESVDMTSGGGGATSDEWIDLGTLTLADGEEAINFSWKVNGQVKKIHIEGVYYSATSGKNLSLFNSDGLRGTSPLITYGAFRFPSSAESAMYMDLTVEELYPGYWFGVGGASVYNNPHENTIASYGSAKRVDSYLSLGAYWRDAPLTAGTWFNVKVVYY